LLKLLLKDINDNYDNLLKKIFEKLYLINGYFDLTSKKFFIFYRNIN